MSGLQMVLVECPYCGEENTLLIDISVSQQEYVEDCTVCCQPMLVRVTVDHQGEIDLLVRRENL